ncbi:unnamed protein product [Wuchereria bancrofti]|uniref:Uncharacterized protein n=1 Tax=Wuchereria bancrofti TaxID=6293 RepID=A0A3P7DSA6_WUCBA|nr:unnamed protein product [Wuchereria bancrofti]
MIPANQSETIDDAISNWGTVQKIERKVPLKKVYNFLILINLLLTLSIFFILIKCYSLFIHF